MLFKGGDGLWIEMLTLLLLLLCLALQVDPPLIGCRRAGMEASCEQVSEMRASMRHCGREGITCMSTCVCVHMCVVAFRLRCPATRHVSRVHPFLSQAYPRGADKHSGARVQRGACPALRMAHLL
jgi:hypothetical protein